MRVRLPTIHVPAGLAGKLLLRARREMPDTQLKPRQLLREVFVAALEDYLESIAYLRMCKVCGCSDLDACPEGCWWVGPNLCSACQGKDVAHG